MRQQLLIAELLSVAPCVGTERMGEDAGRVYAAVLDFVSLRPGRWIEMQRAPDTFGDLVIGAGGITTHAQPADAALAAIEREAAAERDRAAAYLSEASLLTRRGETLRPQWIPGRDAE